MNRRQFLTLLTTGTLPFAGCAGNDDPEVRTVTVTVTKEPSTTTTTTKTPTRTTTQEESTQTTDSPSETTEPETETETTETETTETPDPEEQAAAHINAASETFWEAFHAFVNGDVVELDFLDITAKTTEFDAAEVHKKLDAAFDELQAASGTASDEQSQTIQKMHTAGMFFRKMTDAQNDLVESYQAVDSLLQGIENENLSAITSAADEISTVVPKAITNQKRASRAALGGFRKFPFLDGDQARRKQAQFKKERHVFESFMDAAEPFADAMTYVSDGQTAYEDGNWNIARNEFQNASGQFADAQKAHDISSPVDHLATIVHSFNCYLSALSGYSTNLEKAADAGLEGDRESRRQYSEDGEDKLSACSTNLSIP